MSSAEVEKPKGFAFPMVQKVLSDRYPAAKNIRWYKNTTSQTYFLYHARFPHNGKEVSLEISFQSYDDGLTWGYFISDHQRMVGKGQPAWEIVPAGLRETIQTQVRKQHPKLNLEDLDVFALKRERFYTPQVSGFKPDPQHKSLMGYGVYLPDEQLLYFDPHGKAQEISWIF